MTEASIWPVLRTVRASGDAGNTEYGRRTPTTGPLARYRGRPPSRGRGAGTAPHGRRSEFCSSTRGLCHKQQRAGPHTVRPRTVPPRATAPGDGPLSCRVRSRPGRAVAGRYRRYCKPDSSVLHTYCVHVAPSSGTGRGCGPWLIEILGGGWPPNSHRLRSCSCSHRGGQASREINGLGEHRADLAKLQLLEVHKV